MCALCGARKGRTRGSERPEENPERINRKRKKEMTIRIDARSGRERARDREQKKRIILTDDSILMSV